MADLKHLQTLIPKEQSAERVARMWRVVQAADGGRARFDIRPGGPRRWTVKSGGVTVTVLGTCFTVERKGEQTAVFVERGKVRVRADGAAEDHLLTAGQSITVGEAPKAPAPEPTIAVPEDAPHAIQADEPSSHLSGHPSDAVVSSCAS